MPRPMALSVSLPNHRSMRFSHELDVGVAPTAACCPSRTYLLGEMKPHAATAIDVPTWSENEIVISGFTGSYGAFGWTLEKGEKVEVEVWNQLDEKGPSCYTTSVG